LVLEWNHDACATIRANQDRGTKIVQGWPVFEGDVRSYDYSKFQEGMDWWPTAHPASRSPWAARPRAMRMSHRTKFPFGRPGSADDPPNWGHAQKRMTSLWLGVFGVEDRTGTAMAGDLPFFPHATGACSSLRLTRTFHRDGSVRGGWAVRG
jgi:hypothetical protein